MDGFAFLRRKEKFVASFRSAIHAFLLFQPLRWLKWLLVPGGKERELNIWRHDLRCTRSKKRGPQPVPNAL